MCSSNPRGQIAIGDCNPNRARTLSLSLSLSLSVCVCVCVPQLGTSPTRDIARVDGTTHFCGDLKDSLNALVPRLFQSLLLLLVMFCTRLLTNSVFFVSATVPEAECKSTMQQ